MSSFRDSHFIRQNIVNESGIACAAMVFKWYGFPDLFNSLKEITYNLLNFDVRFKISLKGLSQLFSVFNFEARGFRINIETLEEVPCPAILLFEEGKYVVLTGIDQNAAILADPSEGIVSVTFDDLKLKWDGALLVIEPPDNLSESIESTLRTIKASCEKENGKDFIVKYKAKLIEQGGVGEIYLGSTDEGDNIIIKHIPQYLQNWGQLNLFRHEMIMSKKVKEIDHPKIVKFGEINLKKSYFIMEYIKNGSLASHTKLFTIKEVNQIVGQLADALTSLHANGIVHQDIKAYNVLFKSVTQVRLCDFGFAFCVDQGSEITNNSPLAPKFHRSPEQLLGSEVSYPTDVYSLGILWLKLLHNQPLYDYEEVKGFCEAHPPEDHAQIFLQKHADLIPICSKFYEEHRNLVPEHCIKMLKSCLAFNVNDRPKMSQVYSYLAGS